MLPRASARYPTPVISSTRVKPLVTPSTMLATSVRAREARRRAGHFHGNAGREALRELALRALHAHLAVGLRDRDAVRNRDGEPTDARHALPHLADDLAADALLA